MGDRELHLVLRSPGGDGEQAIRAIRALQSRCSKLVIVFPDIAKSAATLLALGADEIRLGPASDLGPVDPQMMVGNRWVRRQEHLGGGDASGEVGQGGPDAHTAVGGAAG